MKKYLTIIVLGAILLACSTEQTIKTENNLPLGSIQTDGKGILEIGCSSGSLQVLELQLAGKKRMDIKSFLNGVKLDNTYKCI